ncbi:MAG: hypothetical protein A2Y76_16050 [Planctomycetes bacterium RBG_13_60_9]|nr:MAG: hypothetical protein A2Y76_16050 [Planctomycetes bacterium RBG_13_60_9]
MNRQEIFDAWHRQKQQIAIRPDFSDRVMADIQRGGARGRGNLLPMRTRRIAARPWVKAAVLVAGVLAGLARILMTIHLVLFA